MRRTAKKLEAADQKFAENVGQHLQIKAATLTAADEYMPMTPVGGLHIRVRSNWILCQFAGPAGGRMAIGGASSPYTSTWNRHSSDNAAALTELGALRAFSLYLDHFQDFQPTPKQQEAIDANLSAMRRKAVKLEAFFCSATGEPQASDCRQEFANIKRTSTLEPETGDQLAQACRNKLSVANDARPKSRGRNLKSKASTKKTPSD